MSKLLARFARGENEPDRLRQQGRDFLFLTNNSSKDAQQYAAKLGRLGLPVPPEKILTSGDANKVLSDTRVVEAYLGG